MLSLRNYELRRRISKPRAMQIFLSTYLIKKAANIRRGFKIIYESIYLLFLLVGKNTPVFAFLEVPSADP